MIHFIMDLDGDTHIIMVAGTAHGTSVIGMVTGTVIGALVVIMTHGLDMVAGMAADTTGDLVMVTILP